MGQGQKKMARTMHIRLMWLMARSPIEGRAAIFVGMTRIIGRITEG